MRKRYQYSEGKLYVQEKVDVVRQAASVSRMVKESADGFAQSFVQSQLFGFVSSKDADGNVWTSILAGKHIGFAKFHSAEKLFISKDDYTVFEEDILYQNLTKNPSVGMLFIDLATRRRQRINGKMYQEEDGLRLEIEQSFVNCPKYIQLRSLSNNPSNSDSDRSIEKGKGSLPKHLEEMITKADMFFVGTSAKNNVLETSHRGGNSGFVKLTNNVLKIPDYSGNNMFISLGNMHEHPQTGLLFIDDATGSILQLQGQAKLSFDDFLHESEHPTGGTGRYWYFTIEQYHFHKNRLPYTWQLAEYSPFNP